MRHTVTLPPTAATFSAIVYGAYTPRGYNPSGISSKISGIPISYLFSGRWLESENSGSGSLFTVFDAAGNRLGTFYKPSQFVSGSIELTFVSTKAPASTK